MTSRNNRRKSKRDKISIRVLIIVFFVLISLLPLGYFFRAEIAMGVDTLVNWFTPADEAPADGDELPNSGTDNPDSGNDNLPDSGTDNPDSGTDNPDSGNDNIPDSGTDNPDSGNDNLPDAGTDNPDDGEETSLTCEQMIMFQGSQIHLINDGLSARIRFFCGVENSLVDDVLNNPSKKLGMILAPLDDFNNVNEQNLSCIDWIKEFDAAGKNLIVVEVDTFEVYNAAYRYMPIVLENIPYENINKRYVAWGYLADSTSGETVYQYAMLSEGKTYQDTARSAAYLAGGMMNNYQLGLSTMTDAQYNLMKQYIDMAVDNANGLTEPTLDGSMPEVTSSDGTKISMRLGEGPYRINLSIKPEGLDVPILYRSKNEDIVIVNAKGEITPLAGGTATVEAYVAGKSYQFTVRVADVATAPYDVDYSLDYMDRIKIVRDYYETTYTDAEERVTVFREDLVAMDYLGDYYGGLYELYYSQAFM